MSAADSNFPQNLTGRVIAVPESRSLDIFTRLLERRGAEVIQCPLVGIHNTPDVEPVLDWLRDFNAGACDDLILMTGEGLRRLQSIIEIHAPELREPFIEQLGKVRKVTRGPKPNSELRKLNLERDINALAPTTDGVIETMAQLDLNGRTVGLQLYGSYINPPLVAALEAQGASVKSVAPYVYADDIEEQRVIDLIQKLVAGGVDVIAFTSATQVKRLWSVAKKQDQLAAMEAAFADLTVTAVGPVVRDCLLEKGVSVDLMPEDSFFLKPLVNLLGEKLGPKA
jgi:uroporphyrinogen-III synthase